ncbi:hypothetical protein BU16DRAFT_607510 [Lophium mytilinum]|uniref:Uncharacterized protein n=1 Tax=Lophium mytilinum TaxID=390894 RepID=A0A6A6QX83_9PEZI|nr:hypothetical protein BU16DRAFT_607510 [Lophium mytilinum]
MADDGVSSARGESQRVLATRRGLGLGPTSASPPSASSSLLLLHFSMHAPEPCFPINPPCNLTSQATLGLALAAGRVECWIRPPPMNGAPELRPSKQCCPAARRTGVPALHSNQSLKAVSVPVLTACPASFLHRCSQNASVMGVVDEGSPTVLSPVTCRQRSTRLSIYFYFSHPKTEEKQG